MTGLADDAPTAGGSQGPVSRRHAARVDGDDEALRLANGADQGLHAHGQRREAAVEPDHERACPRITTIADGRLDGIDIGSGKRQRLFDKYVLARGQRALHEVRMGIVPGRDDNRIDFRRGQECIHVGRRRLESVSASVACRIDPVRAGHAEKPGAVRSECGNQHAACIIARADEGYRGTLNRASRRPCAQRYVPHHSRGARLIPVLEDDPKGCPRPVGQQVIRRRGRAKGNPMADQRPHVELPGFHQLQRCLEISLFGPAHQSERIIDSAILIDFVITSGAVGARQPQ